MVFDHSFSAINNNPLRELCGIAFPISCQSQIIKTHLSHQNKIQPKQGFNLQLKQEFIKLAALIKVFHYDFAPGKRIDNSNQPKPEP